jgi:hypothetical protein
MLSVLTHVIAGDKQANQGRMKPSMFYEPMSDENTKIGLQRAFRRVDNHAELGNIFRISRLPARNVLHRGIGNQCLFGTL